MTFYCSQKEGPFLRVGLSRGRMWKEVSCASNCLRKCSLEKLVVKCRDQDRKGERTKQRHNFR